MPLLHRAKQLGLLSRGSGVFSQPQRWMAALPATVPQDDQVDVTVNGQSVKVAKGSNVLQACDAAGVDIPR
jgi:hypothetical protein